MFQNRHENNYNYKEKPIQFRNVAGGVKRRYDDKIKRRKTSRLSMIDSIRNIPKYESPAPISKAQLQIEYQRQQLKKWKLEKENRMKEAAANKKKPFVTGVVRNPVAYNPPPPLPTKKAKSQTLKTSFPKTKTIINERKKLSFAPIDAHFHPPQTIDLEEIPVWTNSKKSKSNDEEVTFEPGTKNTKKSTSVMHTRPKATQNNSDTRATEKYCTKSEDGNFHKSGRYVKTPMCRSQSFSSNVAQAKAVPKKPIPKNVPVPESGQSSKEKLWSPKLLKNQLREGKQQLNNSAKSPLPPEQIKELCQQISLSFIRSRGEEEEMVRKNKEGLRDEQTSNMKSVKSFREQLNSEIRRITELCDSWYKTAEQNVLPETAQELVLGAVGQARLLMSSKLKQFASLVALCERPEPGAEVVTLVDLHGFWDMVYIQIEDINARFLKVEEMRSRGWTEELPGPTAAAPSQAPGRASGRAPRARPRGRPAATGQPSSLREMIAAARKAKKVQQVLSTPVAAAEVGGESSTGGAAAAVSHPFEVDFFSARSPVPVATSRSPSLVQAAKDERPPYAMLRAAGMSRDVELEGIEPLQQTPIQKTPVSSGNHKRSNSRSAKKSVFFDDSLTNSDEPRDKDKDDKPNDTDTTHITELRATVDDLTIDSGLSSLDMEDGYNKENKNMTKLKRDSFKARSPILTRRARKSLRTPTMQSEATPRRRKSKQQ